MAEIDELLNEMATVTASDLHLKVGQKPRFRVNGELNPVPGSEIDVGEGAGADDGSRNPRLGQNPCEREARHRHAALFGDGAKPVHNREAVFIPILTTILARPRMRMRSLFYS